MSGRHDRRGDAGRVASAPGVPSAPGAIRALEKAASIRGRRSFEDARPHEGDTADRGAEVRVAIEDGPERGGP